MDPISSNINATAAPQLPLTSQGENNVDDARSSLFDAQRAKQRLDRMINAF